MKTVTVNGVRIEYVHKKSDRRTISVSVNDDGILEVRSPRRMSDGLVENFILDNGEKILRMLERNRERREYEERLGDAGLAELRRRAAAVIPERVRHYSRIMGVTPQRVRINAARTRFGSCSVLGNLNFSCRVMAYSAKAVDYVVIHELAHLIHMDHSAAFWRVVASYMPDYTDARHELKQIPKKGADDE